MLTAWPGKSKNANQDKLTGEKNVAMRLIKKSYQKMLDRDVDLNHRPLGYEPSEIPDCSIPLFLL